MIRIHEASEADFPTIQHIAHQTWPVTFGAILSPAQVNYMLEWMYSLPSLQEQTAQKGHQFLLAKEENQALGFASYEVNYKGAPATKIHKIYILPNKQGKGIGKALIKSIGDSARDVGNQALLLNVNRYNAAVQFYKHLGFGIIGEENIDIGQGFLMEDYIMKLPLDVTDPQ